MLRIVGGVVWKEPTSTVQRELNNLATTELVLDAWSSGAERVWAAATPTHAVVPQRSWWKCPGARYLTPRWWRGAARGSATRSGCVRMSPSRCQRSITPRLSRGLGSDKGCVRQQTPWEMERMCKMKGGDDDLRCLDLANRAASSPRRHHAKKKQLREIVIKRPPWKKTSLETNSGDGYEMRDGPTRRYEEVDDILRQFEA